MRVLKSIAIMIVILAIGSVVVGLLGLIAENCSWLLAPILIVLLIELWRDIYKNTGYS